MSVWNYNSQYIAARSPLDVPFYFHQMSICQCYLQYLCFNSNRFIYNALDDTKIAYLLRCLQYSKSRAFIFTAIFFRFALLLNRATFTSCQFSFSLYSIPCCCCCYTSFSALVSSLFFVFFFWYFILFRCNEHFSHTLMV